MNATERVKTALTLGEPDRVPVFPQIGDHAGIVAGLTYDTMYADARLASRAHLDALDSYGYDVVAIQVEPSWPIAEACGAEVFYPPDKCPWITRHIISRKEDVEKLQVPDFMATRSSAVMIEGTALLAEEADVPVAAFVPGPLTFAFQLMPYQDVMVAMTKDRPFVHELVKRSADIIEEYARRLHAAGASVCVVCEHDVQMVMPRDLGELSIAYLDELLQIFPYNLLHLCGKVRPHLEENASAIMALESLNMISIDSVVDLAWAKSRFAGHIGVAGNIDHLQLLPHGLPEAVDAACKAAIEAGKTGGGYILAPGCEITGDTPAENVTAMVKAAVRYGEY